MFGRTLTAGVIAVAATLAGCESNDEHDAAASNRTDLAQVSTTSDAVNDSVLSEPTPETDAPEVDTPVEAIAAMTDNGFKLSPATFSPGQLVDIVFDDDGPLRGVAWTLTALDESGSTFYLNSDRPDLGDSFNIAWTEQIQDWEFPWVGIMGGGGPDSLIVPPTANAGSYELCIPGPEPICAEIMVVA
ncbi:MAG: hypothetical protein AAGF73_04465 [Actinomycetota bacterium]